MPFPELALKVVFALIRARPMQVMQVFAKKVSHKYDASERAYGHCSLGSHTCRERLGRLRRACLISFFACR